MTLLTEGQIVALFDGSWRMSETQKQADGGCCTNSSVFILELHTIHLGINV
jgi:hypothetical protein